MPFVAAMGASAICGCAADGAEPAIDGHVLTTAGAPAEVPASGELEVARMEQALGEPGCLTVAADQVWDGQRRGYSSGDNTYDHPECRDAFIVDASGLPAGTELLMQGSVPLTGDVITGVLSCGFHFGVFQVYRKIDGNYERVYQEAKFAAIEGQMPLIACNLRVRQSLAEAGDYRVIVSARALLGPKIPVSARFH